MFKKIVGLGFSSKGKNAKDVEKYIKTLVDGGASEFFTGYNPAYWSDKFGFEVSPNGRFAEHEQITDFETLAKIVEEVHKYDLEIFANLNAWYYTEETFPLIEKMVEEFEKVGVDGIICANISILEYLKNKNYSGKINISTIMAVYNSENIRFLLENYKINKIILSREVTLKEIENLVKTFSDTKFEVFGEGDFCRYNNALCFAEHKYGVKDICTVVVNDLIIKKKFKAEFKKIILDKNLSNEQKFLALKDDYKNIFEQIDGVLEILGLGLHLRDDLEIELYELVEKAKDRVDLYFDAQKPIFSERNKRILIFLKALRFLISPKTPFLQKEENADKKEELIKLEEEIQNSLETGMKYLSEKTKNIGGEAKLKAFTLANFYARGDILNLYSYLFFSKFENIETVKFPTRGRNYNEKLKIIEEVVNSGEIDEKYFDRGMSIERAHYDLTYLFGDKLWFREMLGKVESGK